MGKKRKFIGKRIYVDFDCIVEISRIMQHVSQGGFSDTYLSLNLVVLGRVETFICVDRCHAQHALTMMPQSANKIIFCRYLITLNRYFVSTRLTQVGTCNYYLQGLMRNSIIIYL